MIPVGIPQNLGKKTLIIMILQGTLPGVAFLILVIIASFFKESVNSNLISTITSVGQVLPAVGQYLLSAVPLFIPSIFLLACIFGGIGVFVNILRYHFFLFTLEEFGIKLRKGVLRVTEITIPYRQMQNVDVTRSLVYRFFGLSRLVILSAGHEQQEEGDQVDTVFDPIDFEVAEEIRDLLGRRIGVQVIEHESEADEEQEYAKRMTCPPDNQVSNS